MFNTCIITKMTRWSISQRLAAFLKKAAQKARAVKNSGNLSPRRLKF
jgi:hypothetical protein